MTTNISKVANLALQVFNQHSLKASLSSNMLSKYSLPTDKLNQLLTMLNKIDGKYVGFDINWTKNITVKDGTNVSAPVIYIHIMENEVFSLGIFVLRPGSRVPLHDHPNMFGIVKVIHGKVRCHSYSRVSTKLPLSSFTSRLATWQMSDLVAAQPCQDSVLEIHSEPVLLAPTEGNFHELFTVGNEGAAFVDILAQPYDYFLGKRECHYYKEVRLAGDLINVKMEQRRDITLESVTNSVTSEEGPEFHLYKKRFGSDILYACLLGANLLFGIKNGLSLLDRSGQGNVYNLISLRKFLQMDVLEGQNAWAPRPYHKFTDAVNVLGVPTKVIHWELLERNDNSRPHVATLTKVVIMKLGWEVLQHPPYSLDLAPSDYHIFRVLSTALRGVSLQNDEELQNWLQNWFKSKNQTFYRHGMERLAER